MNGLPTPEAEQHRNDVRIGLVLSDPDLTEAIAGGGAFGGAYSAAVAQNMYDRYHEEAIDDAKRLVTVDEVGPRSWLVRLPIVNCAVFETGEGLVVADTGMAPAGPAILQAIRTVSDAPIHTIIYTHAHVDHCMGTWALMADNPRVIAHHDAIRRFDRYVRLRGSISRYLSQPLASFPASGDDWVPPTETFTDTMSITVGGEQFDLIHRRGETDDQLYVSVPGRQAVASADYYQGFLPNAGNGKRVQRYVEEWAIALREMVALEPRFLLPAHGEPVVDDPDRIAEVLTVHAEALEHIVAHTLDGLNQRLRQDEVADSVALPSRLAEHPTLNEQYVSPADISRMVMKQYCGWWDDIPSHWSPARFDQQAVAICELAGGVDAVVARARELAEADPVMACHLIDWAWFADPNNRGTGRAVLDLYINRITTTTHNTQEALMYLDHMTDVQLGMDRTGG
ncbi:MAG: MBL fold metallo-hydrolase [Acidimicrobiales bacterium]|nr:MBL fold metallo-hydrolase [Acidimicrobiales bacterium]